MFRFRLLVVAFVVFGTVLAGGVPAGADEPTYPLVDLAGFDGRMQAAALARAPMNLRVVIVEECSDEVEAGKVTRSEPGAGTRVTPGSDITLFVSKGTTNPLRYTSRNGWNDCVPRAFDATNPQAVLREMNKGGVGCRNARNSGSDRVGGRYITCMVGKQPVIIRAWPSFTAAQTYWTRIADVTPSWYLSNTKYTCFRIWLFASRYQIELNAVDATLSVGSDLVLSIRRALNLPYDVREGKAYWNIQLQSRQGSGPNACDIVTYLRSQ